MNMTSDETMEPGAYPERPGEPDCSYYIRAGLCRFGSTCRFNHPRDRELVLHIFTVFLCVCSVLEFRDVFGRIQSWKLLRVFLTSLIGYSHCKDER